MYRLMFLPACLSLWANGALAGDDGLALTVQYLQAGTLSAGEAALEAHLKQDPRDDQARFGLGAMQFLRSIEGLTQSAYRHGFMQPLLRTMGGFQIETFPFRINDKPERLRYQQARAIIQVFASQLATAEATLARVESDTVKLPLHPGLIRLDFDGDGNATDDETFWQIYATFDASIEDRAKEFVVTFDAADVCWLRGYCHLLLAFAEFTLAHDWRELFERTGHLLVAEIDPPFPFAQDQIDLLELSAGGGLNFYADMFAFFHLINFDVAEPKRMEAVLQHLEATVGLSRRSWDLILKESDDDREWIPSPKQTGVIPDVKITPQMAAGWQEFLIQADSILKGKKLLPFWRSAGGRGLNLRKVFTHPQRFDLVLWIQGTGVIPFLEAGEVSDTAAWERITRVFEGPYGFIGFAFWFN